MLASDRGSSILASLIKWELQEGREQRFHLGGQSVMYLVCPSLETGITN
jgi:hypothetical protein